MQNKKKWNPRWLPGAILDFCEKSVLWGYLRHRHAWHLWHRIPQFCATNVSFGTELPWDTRKKLRSRHKLDHFFQDGCWWPSWIFLKSLNFGTICDTNMCDTIFCGRKPALSSFFTQEIPKNEIQDGCRRPSWIFLRSLNYLWYRHVWHHFSW